MKQLLSALLVAAVVLFSVSASAQQAQHNTRQVIMAETEVANGAPVSVTITNPWHKSGYLVIKTANETGAASLVVTIFNVHGGVDHLVCTSSAITTETTTTMVLGSSLTAAAPYQAVDCIWPMGEVVKFTFTDSVGATDFDVTAHMEWLVE
jgi:hypothetical protein